MTKEIAVLSTIAEEINALNVQVEQAQQQAVVCAAKMGEKLLQAKAQCKHGEFKRWIEVNCTVSYSHAANFMKLATDMPELLDDSKVQSTVLLDDSKVQSTVLLGLQQAIELLSAPKKVRKSITKRIEAGEKITVKEIKQAKEEAKEPEPTVIEAEYTIVPEAASKIEEPTKAKMDALLEEKKELDEFEMESIDEMLDSQFKEIEKEAAMSQQEKIYRLLNDEVDSKLVAKIKEISSWMIGKANEGVVTAQTLKQIVGIIKGELVAIEPTQTAAYSNCHTKKETAIDMPEPREDVNDDTLMDDTELSVEEMDEIASEINRQYELCRTQPSS